MNTIGFPSLLPKLLPVPVPPVVEGALRNLLGLGEIERIYADLQSNDTGKAITQRLLDHLRVTCRVAEKDLARVPRRGGLMLVVNHPHGILEGAALASILSQVRGDVKLLANGILANLPELRDLVIAVDPMGSAARENRTGVRESIEHLARGGMLVVFPAGEVSHFQWSSRSIADSAWNESIARLLAVAERRSPGISVVPAYVEGANSIFFQAAGVVHARLRTALLGRELLNKRGKQVNVRIGAPVAVEKLLAIPTNRERIDYLRWRTYLLATRNEYKPLTSAPLLSRTARIRPEQPVAAPADPEACAADVAALPAEALLLESGEYCVYIAGAHQLPALLPEIGRLREIAFRTAGEGTGKARDLDSFDQHYLHLFVWNCRKLEVAGAYRIAKTEELRRTGLYTATLFSYGDEFLNRLGPALELGRSFVSPEYQKSFGPLLLLWKGIGRFVARNPECKTLFGPVSISNEYHSVSRQLMVSFLERNAWMKDWAGLISSRNPFRPARARLPEPSLPGSAFDLEDLSAVVSDIDPAQAGVPVLLRQYLKLGGKLLGFNVDPDFAQALDGLIVVDLTKTETKLLERYLGKSEAGEFLAFHRGRS